MEEVEVWKSDIPGDGGRKETGLEETTKNVSEGTDRDSGAL